MPTFKNSINFNPRSPSGLRPAGRRTWYSKCAFQSTQPEWAATCFCQARSLFHNNFNPRSPSGLRHKTYTVSGELVGISIHAARVGCDYLETCWRNGSKKFQSTQPEWAATITRLHCWNWLWFQSTQPEWAATAFTKSIIKLGKISIHAARVGCDSIRINCNYYSFYSYKSAKLTFLLN